MGNALETAAHYTPEQSGISERANDVVLTRAQAMMPGSLHVDAVLSLEFWLLTVRVKAYILNHTLQRRLLLLQKDMSSCTRTDSSRMQTLGVSRMRRLLDLVEGPKTGLSGAPPWALSGQRGIANSV
jgi:hypothetical protein